MSSSSSSLPYDPPPWSCDPLQQCRLIEIKSGVQVAVYDLTAACTVLGRAVEDWPAPPTSRKIPLLHESCSRLHARIAFDKQGIMWLRDLASVHGTTVNKKRLPAIACGKVETNDTTAGARGVVLKTGDVIQFGASTRLYCVEGPDNDANPSRNGTSVALGISNEVKRTQQQQIQQQAKEQQETPETVLDFNDPDVIVPDKYRTEWEQLKALHYKFTNIQTESERIRRKGGAFLTEGQEAQLQRNQEREAILAQEIESRKEALLEKLNAGNQTQRNRQPQQRQHQEEEEDIDDFYDKTKDSQNDNGFSDEAMSEEDLISAWNTQHDAYMKASDSFMQLRRRVDQLRDRLQDLERRAQDGDAFFAKNELDLVTDEMKRKQQLVNTVVDQLKETKRLLQIVNSTVASRLQIGQAFEKRSALNSQDSKKDDVFSMPAPPPPARTQPTEPLPPPPKRQRVHQPQLRPTLPADMMQPKQVPVYTNQATAQKASRHSNSTIAAIKASSELSAKQPPPATKTTTKRDNDEKQDSWQAPKDQDGSGWTKLNQKFAGRY